MYVGYVSACVWKNKQLYSTVWLCCATGCVLYRRQCMCVCVCVHKRVNVYAELWSWLVLHSRNTYLDRVGGCVCRWEDSAVVWVIRPFVLNLVHCIKMPLSSCRTTHKRALALPSRCLAYICILTRLLNSTYTWNFLFFIFLQKTACPVTDVVHPQNIFQTEF